MPSDSDIELGNWNEKTRIFTPGGKPQDAARVVALAPRTPMFFGRMMGSSDSRSQAQAIAAFRPRDIMLVLDVSGSMSEARNGIRKIDELKEAVRVFFDYINRADGNDRVGFVYYSSRATLGNGLSLNLALVQEKLLKVLNPSGMTNIADGMMLARNELNVNRRSNAALLIVLLTDGATNMIQPENRSNVTEAKRRVIVQANLAKTDGLPIFTMALDSLTGAVDVALMAEVARITGSESYHIIAGDRDVSGSLLVDAFRRVALNRPLRRVE